MNWKIARKKPITIEFREVKYHVFIEELQVMGEKISTLEGVLYAVPEDDFIIRGVQGEIYPIKKDIFYKTYDVIDNEL